jgi:hypothetical protein
MIVYHGSYTKINEIDLTMSMPRKDFGKGFYVTKIRSQAETWAKRIGVDNNSEGVVTEFIFYENAFIDGSYRVLRFDKYDENWLDFVTLNRRKDAPIPAHHYDIVEGPVADDRISENITRYIKGKIPKEKFLSMLSREEPTHQICFCAVDSLLMLELKDNSNDIDYEVSEISGKIMEQLVLDFNLEEEKAADLFFSSAVFGNLSEKSTEFYLKTWNEIYELLKKELNKASN